MNPAAVAAGMLTECCRTGQAARTVAGDADAAAIRRELRHAAREQSVHIRTARMGDAVVVARTDAKLWSEDTATMRRKLTPTAP